jgi:hypothetical protein
MIVVVIRAGAHHHSSSSLPRVASRAAKSGLTVVAAEAATIAECTQAEDFCSSALSVPSLQPAGLWTVHVMWCLHKLTVRSPCFFFLGLPSLGGTFFHASSFFWVFLLDVSFLFFALPFFLLPPPCEIIGDLATYLVPHLCLLFCYGIFWYMRTCTLMVLKLQ